MSLRDELLAQKQKEKEEKVAQDKLAASENAKRKAEAEKRIAEERERKFEEIEHTLVEGKMPDDWQKKYDRYLDRIKKILTGSAEEFDIVDTVTEKYYNSLEEIKKGNKTAVTLFNQCLTKKLEEEGFHNVVVALRDRIEYYSTDADYENQSREQAANDAAATAAYLRAADDYWNNRTGSMPDSSDRAYSSRTAVLRTSGKRHHYEIVVKGSLYKFNNATQKKYEKKSRFFSVLPIVTGVLGFIGGLYFPIFGSIFGVVALGILAPIIFAALGFLVGKTVGWIANCVRSMRIVVADDRIAKETKPRLIAINILKIVAFLLILTAIAGLIAFVVINPFDWYIPL